MNLLSLLAVPLITAGILILGLWKKENLTEAFAEGAKQGLKTAAAMIPPLVLFLTVLGMFEASGGLDILCHALAPFAKLMGIPPEVLPLGLLRPLSGSGSLAVFREILAEYGPDSYIGRTASVIQSASETTFYTLAVYFGAAGITRQRYTLLCCLAGDAAIILLAGQFVKLLL